MFISITFTKQACYLPVHQMTHSESNDKRANLVVTISFLFFLRVVVVAFFVSWKGILQWEFRGFSSKKWREYCIIDLLEDAG